MKVIIGVYDVYYTMTATPEVFLSYHSSLPFLNKLHHMFIPL